MKTQIVFKKYFLIVLAVTFLLACDHQSITEEQESVYQKESFQKTEKQNKTSTSVLYRNFVSVLRDIEDTEIMTYSEFEKEYRGTNDEERILLEEEINEALRGIDSQKDFSENQTKAGNSCKTNVVSRLTHSRFKALGRSRARVAWSNKARKKYGWKYRKWSKAKDRDYYFYTDGTQYLLWKYRAYGKPCK